MTDRRNFEYYLQGKVEASALIIAFVVGGFTLLQMFENTQIGKSAWYALTSVYFSLLALIWFMIRIWLDAGLKREQIRRNKPEKEAGRFTKYFARIILTGIGVWLWVSIAFHCGFGMPLTENNLVCRPSCRQG